MAAGGRRREKEEVPMEKEVNEEERKRKGERRTEAGGRRKEKEEALTEEEVNEEERKRKREKKTKTDGRRREKEEAPTEEEVNELYARHRMIRVAIKYLHGANININGNITSHQSTEVEFPIGVKGIEVEVRSRVLDLNALPEVESNGN